MLTVHLVRIRGRWYLMRWNRVSCRLKPECAHDEEQENDGSYRQNAKDQAHIESPAASAFS